MLLGSLALALGALEVLHVELARGVLHRGGDWAGYLAGAGGAGGVLAVLVTARLVGRAFAGPVAALVGVGAILPVTALLCGRRLLDIDRDATVPVVEIELLRAMSLFAALAPPTLETVARALTRSRCARAPR